MAEGKGAGRWTEGRCNGDTHKNKTGLEKDQDPFGRVESTSREPDLRPRFGTEYGRDQGTIALLLEG